MICTPFKLFSIFFNKLLDGPSIFDILVFVGGADVSDVKPNVEKKMIIQSYTNKQGKSFPQFESSHSTNAEAAEALKAKYESGKFASNPDFAQSVLDAWRWSIAPIRPKPLYNSMQYWLHKLSQPEVQQVAASTFDLSRVNTMFSSAKENLKRPAIVLSNGKANIKISFAGERSKYNGQIIVAAPTFGAGFYGRIDKDGNWFPTASCDAEVSIMVRDFAANPEKAAAAHGRLTGKCCFCNKGLTDARSTEVGYGPVCATHFGLQWGSRVATPRHRRVLVAA